ncbi:methyltransferase [Fusarium pseudoanthophilum]|uniref:Methyltransferase n=1 Tax=Fusarium pseudoanthophilum TaxID=48495 RepID=A0A8H5KEK2_9HYPO|nr:methyltransferase [Fusarium pseudoanthophilum]
MDDPTASFKDDVEAVRSAIRQETEKGRDVIVITHSYGGTVGNSAVKDFSRPAKSSVSGQSSASPSSSSERTPETGHVVGIIPIATGFCFTGLTFMDHFLNITPPFFRVNKKTGYADLTVRPQKFFYHDLPPAEADHATSMLTTQSLKALFEGRDYSYSGWLDVPVWFIGTIEDQGLPVLIQRAQIGTVRMLGARVVYTELKTSHSPFLSQPTQVVQIILQAFEAFTGTRADGTPETLELASGPKSTPSPRGELIPAADNDDDVQDDADSTLETDAESSTASVSSSILHYRSIQGRTFHSDKFVTEYSFPNDEQQLESVDISHHYLTVLLDGQLYLAPIGENVQKALDVGTGSGIWAIDFADQFPQAEVTATDLSPTQPKWVPPNVRFEIDDATETWTWKDNTFDFVHMRYLFGAIQDWTALYQQAYRVCTPGGWVESVEADIHFRSDDGTAEEQEVYKLCNKLYEEGGKAIGRTFFVHELQPTGMEEAGFVDIKTVDYKIPIGDWPKDSRLAEVGRFVKLTLENDIEGYTLLLWNNVLQWPKDEYQVFLMQIRKALRNRKIHGYFVVRYVYGRKPE